MNESIISIPIKPLSQEEIDAIKEEHFDCTTIALLAPSIIKLLIDASFENLSVKYDIYDHRLLASSTDLTIANTIKNNIDSLINDSMNSITIRHDGSNYTIEGLEEVLDLYTQFELIEKVAISQESDSRSSSDVREEIIFESKSDVLRKALTELITLPPNRLSNENFSNTAFLYRTTGGQISEWQEYFAHKAIRGVSSEMKNSTTINNEDISKAEKTVCDSWERIFTEPKRHWFSDKSYKSGTFCQESLFEFLQFFPDIELANDIYSDFYYELGSAVEF